MLNILVIEDYPPDVVLLKAYLQEASFKHNFFHSSTLQEGFDILKENEIDLVLLDLSLADSAGFNTLRKYLKESPDVPVIVMTGMRNEVVGMQSVKAGAQDFLIKGDFNSKSLVKSLRYSLERFKNNSKLQKKADELKEADERNKETLAAEKIGSWEMDIVDRSMTWDEGMFRIFGFQPSSLSPTLSDYLNYVHFEDRNKVDTFFDRVIQGAKEPRLEHRIIVNGTNIKHLAINARVKIKGDRDKIILMGSIQDMTDRKKVEDQQLNGESLSSQLDFFGNLVPALHPKITLDLMPIFQSFKSERSAGGDNSVAHLKALVQSYYQLLQFAMFNNCELKTTPYSVNVKDLFGALQSFLNNFLNEREEVLKIQSGSEMPEKIFIDPNWLFQLIYSLYLFSEKQPITSQITTTHFSTVKNKAGVTSLHLDVHGRFKKIGHVNTFTEKSLLQSLKDKTEHAQETMYLLTILKIIHHLDGNYNVKMGPNATLKFSIDIPMAEPNSASAEAEENRDQTSRATNVLIAEDHSINRITMKRMLTSWSGMVNVKIAENGKEALEIFENEKLDVILMDLKMPIMNGLEAATKIRLQSNIPIIALTNSSSDEEKQECYSHGLDAYLSKPLKPQQLYETISSLLH